MAIVATPDTLHGAARLDNQRMPVTSVLRALQDMLRVGRGIDAIYESYPTVSHEDVLDCLRYVIAGLESGRWPYVELEGGD